MGIDPNTYRDALCRIKYIDYVVGKISYGIWSSKRQLAIKEPLILSTDEPKSAHLGVHCGNESGAGENPVKSHHFMKGDIST